MFHIRNNNTSVRLIDRSQTGAYSNVTCSPVYVGVTLFSKPLTCLKHVPLRFKRPRSSQSGFKVCHIVTDVCRNHDSMGISSPTESALYACCRFGRGLHASTKEIPSEVKKTAFSSSIIAATFSRVHNLGFPVGSSSLSR